MTDAREKDILVGSKDLFAVRFAFQRDPHDGAGATPEERISWGAFEIWADGRNLCQHLDFSQPLPSVNWYLLPLLEWLSSNWDFLLHEERLPVNAAADAWRAMEDFPPPPTSLGDVDALDWEERWQHWWNRHAMVSSRQGGLFPSVMFRRWRDEIEVSWGDERVAGCPDHFRFDQQPGFVRLEPQTVADVLSESLRDAAGHLQGQMPESSRLNRLAEEISRFKKSDQRRRLGLLCGAVAETDPERQWGRIESLFPAELSGDIRDEVLGVTGDALVVPGDRQAVLMFGSLSPTISDADARLLADKLVGLYSVHGDGSKLANECRSVPLQNSDQRAWKQGYDLAEEFLESLELPIDRQQWIDVDEIYRDLDVSVEEIALDDAAIRAVAIAGPHQQPTVLINSTHRFQDPERRRFTLAHELCHLLYDRSYGARLAIATGPWAPVDIEQRANAFAAMLLMPRTLLATAVSSLHQPLAEEESVWEVANRLHTSFTATLDHLCNLGYLDSDTRDAIRTRVESRAAAPQTRNS